MKKVITTAIILVIFSSGSVTLAYGLPVFWGKHVDGMIWSVDISGNGKYMAAGADLGNNRGMVYFIDKDGNILWSQEEDRIIGKVSLSRDGSYVLASGYQIKGGAAQVYANPSVYLFDQSGKLIWNFQNTNSTSLTPDNQFFEGSIDPLGKNILILADYQIFFLDRSGNLLWNHKMDGRDGPNKISEDGSTIAIGTIHDNEDNVWELTVFDNLGNLKWRYKGIDGIVQGNALAISSDGQNVVIGSMASGEYGNLYKFDKTGNIIWQRNNVSGGVLNVDMSGDGSSIVVGTNNGMLLFNGDGEEIASDPTWYPTISSDGKSIASSGLVGDYDYGIAFFDGKLNPIWRIPNAGSDVNKISKDGTFIIAGTRLPDYTSKSDDLYFFEGQQKSATEQFSNDIKPLSPRAQFEKGVAAEDVVCKEDLELIIKAKNHSPACVKPETKQKLIQRGWTIEAKQEPESVDKNDFAINEENKVDLSNPKIPRDKDGRIDYDELVKLVSKPYFSKLLTERNVEHDPENIVLMIGPRITMYTEYSSACGYVIADDGEDYWLKSFLDYDTLTEAKIMDENPDPCKPNYGSCFCDAQIHKAENTMKELSYLTISEEQTIGKTVQKYLNNTKIANVPDKFIVGKYNLESESADIHYCGQFVWEFRDTYFEGYIKNSSVIGFGLAFEKPKLCAINDNAQVFYFDKRSIQYD
jgi:hypothetical protein